MRSIIPITALLALGAEAQPAPPASRAPSAQPPGAADFSPSATEMASFAGYLGRVRATALAQGVSAATLERELAGLTPNPRVITLDIGQPDDSGAAPPSFSDYAAKRVAEPRIGRGVAKLGINGATLAAVEGRYGVPGAVLVSIWGLETNYGGYTGDFDVIRSTATLAWEGRRRALFEGELIAALRLIDRGQVTRAQLTGSWAGAMGHPQFLPTSYERLAADGDGDGRRDIWSNEADVLASIANYLAANGWVRGQGWGTPVFVPASLERWRVRSITRAKSCAGPLAAHSRWLSIAEWRGLGVQPVSGALPPDTTLATLVEPDGEGRGAYLTYGNFRALLSYNCSNYYALSVGLLADRFRDAPVPLAGADPAAGGSGGLR